MQGDFSRLTHYAGATRVLMQQGRVQLDADWNELVAVLLGRTRRLAADLIGPHGGPRGNVGYRVFTSDDADTPFENIPPGDFGIGAGRYYVSGWDCETADLLYTEQPDLPGTAALDEAEDGTLWAAHVELWGGKPDVEVGNDLLVYLDVWERHVSAAEDPALTDVALGGLDTATRAVLMAQVRVVPGPPAPATGVADEPAAVAHLERLFPEDERPQLRARARQPKDKIDPCLSDPDARYRGVENQLYRVEIQRGGKLGEATFKWSRDNGSVVFPVDALEFSSDTGGRVSGSARLAHLGRDGRSTLDEGDWVELLDEVRAKRGAPGVMLRITGVDADEHTVTFTPAVGVDPDVAWVRPLLRRWDHRPGREAEGGALLDGGALRVREGQGELGWIKLEDGVEVQFQPTDSERNVPLVYRSGDYWLIPARTATGDVEWPHDGDGGALARAPRGIRHHYAPLALVGIEDGEVRRRAQYRRGFGPLAEPLPAGEAAPAPVRRRRRGR